MNMNYASNRVYFKPKKALRYIGGAFCLFAVPLFFLFLPLAIFSLVIGVLCLLVNRELNVRDVDVNEQIKAETDRLAAALEEKYYDVKHPYPKMMVTVVGDYVTEGEGLQMRRSTSAAGRYITSRYHVAAIGTKNGRLYYWEERFSTVDDSDFSESDGEYDFAEIDRVEFGAVEGATIPHSEFVLFAKNGEEVLRVPAPSDYTTEKYVEDLNAVFARAHEESAPTETVE